MYRLCQELLLTQSVHYDEDARQTTFHTAQPNWGVARAWPTRHPQKKRLQTHGGRPFREECALNPNSAWPKPFTSWDLQEAFNDILRSPCIDNLEVSSHNPKHPAHFSTTTCSLPSRTCHTPLQLFTCRAVLRTGTAPEETGF
eukprot:scaffold10958_cov200-Isochrysis_galbana.AAC.1